MAKKGMQVHFVARENGPERLVTEAEVLFDDGPLAGTKLVGFSLWKSPDGEIYVSVVLTPGPCWTQPPQEYEGYAAIERCTDNGFGRIAVEGNPTEVQYLLDTLRVEDYRPAAVTVSV